MLCAIRLKIAGRSSTLLTAILSLISPAQQSFAQSYIQPPEVSVVDKNGVDLLSGSATLTVKRGSIGSGIGELDFSDQYTTGVFANNNNMYNFVSIWYTGKGEVETATINFNNSSMTFRLIGATWVEQRTHGDTLTQSSDGNTMILTTKSGEIRTYGIPSGMSSPTYLMLLTRTQPNGVVWNYTWEKNTYAGGYVRPTSVTNNLGYEISLSYAYGASYDWEDNNNLKGWLFPISVSFYNLSQSLSPILTASGSSMATDGTEDVTIVTSSGETWKTQGLNFATSPETLSGGTFYVKTPSSSTMNFSYAPVYMLSLNEPITTSLVTNGQTYTYKFNLDTSANGETIVTDPLGNTTDVKFSSAGGTAAAASFPNSVTDSLGNTTTYSNGLATGGFWYMITGITRPAGDQDQYTYDTRYNITTLTHVPKPGSGQSNIVQSATFPTDCDNAITCNKPTSTTDANGNVTQYTYDPTHGGVLTVTSPAVNGISPVIRYSYVQRYAWILNGSGGYVKAATPVWLKNDERTCRTTATVSGACSGGSTDEIVTTYQYGSDAGPNNLLLRGVTVSSNGQSVLTCYAYDAVGNKISETKPLGTGATCS